MPTPAASVGSSSSLVRARTAVALSFALNGAFFATLVSRFPDIREQLGLSNTALGLLLICGSAGSMLALPVSGRIIERFKPAATVRGGALLVSGGLLVMVFAATVLEHVVLAGVGLLVYGVGVSVWDVAMNVEGAEVERRLNRTIMPRFHAAWSAGSIVGSGIGIVMAAAHVPVLVHAVVVGAVVLTFTLSGSRAFLPVEPHHADDRPRGSSAWTEPRTLLLGLMVLCYATVEGTANDWLSLAIIDGYDTPHWVGVSGFAAYVVAMTLGRVLGPYALDRFGRAPVLWISSAAAAGGVALTVFGGVFPLVFLGIVVWGLGSALGFPVGMSAAADDPARAAARVSVVATVGYAAFLGGPPLLGMLGDAVGTLEALTVVIALMVPAALAVFAVRNRS